MVALVKVNDDGCLGKGLWLVTLVGECPMVWYGRIAMPMVCLA